MLKAGQHAYKMTHEDDALRGAWAVMIAAYEGSSPKTAIPAPADGQVASQREAVAWQSLNVNDTVKVKLTDLGREVHKAYWEPFSAGRYLPPKVDPDGFSDFQLWDLMATFGHKIRMGMDVPFETNIRVKVHSPTDQSSDVSGLVEALSELTAIVRGECPRLLDEDSGGYAELSMKIDEALAQAQQVKP